MANTYNNILKYGLQANYDALATKDASVLYFCTDTKKIYKGDIDFTDSVVFASTKPTTGIIKGKLYVIADTKTVEVYNGSAWSVVSYGITTAVSATSTDTEVPSAKAVYAAITGSIAEGVTDVKKSTVAGNVTITKNGVDSDIQIKDVVTTPTYDATTRKFTFPVTGGDDVVVELGTDIFIDPTANNRYENGYLYLYLNDGSATKDPTELKIPVTALITDYFGDDTDSIQVDIDKDTHKVTATAVIRPDSTVTGAEFTNALKVSSVEGAKGLYVDLSAVEDAIQDNADAIAVLNGDATKDGSVAKSIKDAIELLDATAAQSHVGGTTDDGLSLSITEVDGKITAISGSIAVNTYDAYGAAAAVQGETTETVKSTVDNLAALATATTAWGTF